MSNPGDAAFNWARAMTDRIERTLIRKDESGRWHEVRQEEIAAFARPVVILGDPGLGKTELTKALGELPRMNYIRAGTFERHANPASLIAAAECIVIDGADEIASAASGGAVAAVLRKLSAMGYPPFILSCREADWTGAADLLKIEDDYDTTPVLLHLRPFTRDDATAFLAAGFPTVDVERLLDSLVTRGLDGLYGNPLTLRMLGEVMREDGRLPETRAELFERACHVMLQEDNPRHHEASHVKRRTEDLLLAAGAICAAQILCDFASVYTGSYRTTPDGFMNIVDLADLPFGDLRDDAIRTRLFQAEGENRFVHVHRAVAEYLGARWLARCFEDDVSERRVFSLFRHGEGVPTSLRGLHAWMAHFSDALAKRCIDADPYAVLRYGDAATLGVQRARDLLAALTELSERDPYFRAEDRDRHPASGLMRLELRDNVRAIIEVSCGSAHLRLLLLEVIAGTALAEDLADALEAILFDHNRLYAERSLSRNAIQSVGACSDWEHVIGQLVATENPDSAQLACDILVDIGAGAVSTETAIETVLAHLCVTANRVGDFGSHGIRQVPDRLFDDLNPARLAELLDGLSERARPLIRGAGYSAQSYVADLVRRLAVRVLEPRGIVEPARLWSWIDWLDGHRGYRRETKRRLSEIFRENLTVRVALIEHVLLTPCAKNTWLAGFRLSNTKLDLFPTADDLACVLRKLRARVGSGPIDAEMWRGLLNLARKADGLPAVVRDEAERAADDDTELLAVLAEMSEVVQSDREIKEAKRKARSAKKRRAVLKSHCASYRKKINDIAAGDPGVLYWPAAVYLGQVAGFGKHVYVDSEAAPRHRLRDYLGKKLSRKVVVGFIAVLSRPDLPTAAEIAETHCESKRLVAEAPMICGIAELLNQGQAIDGIDRNVLAATYMARQQAPLSHGSRETDICPALEAVLFQCEADWEEHFRAFIEPQLARGHQHVFGLHRLADDPRFANVAGRLAAEWLRCFPALPADIQEQHFACVLKNAPHEMAQALAAESRTIVHPDDETRLLWLAANYAVDFESSRAALVETAAGDKDFLWFIRKRFPSEGEGVFERFLTAQLVFIVEAFGSHWPRAERPPNIVTSGDRNPWDATKFIENAIYAIAGRPSPEATEALQDLIAGHAPTYAGTMKHALAQQRRGRRDFEYSAPTIDEVRSTMTNDLPDTIDQMRVWFADRIEELQKQLRGSNTDIWKVYWTEAGKPQEENYCRDRMIEQVSGNLPESIRLEREVSAPGYARMDIALTRNTIKLPVEIKGQWHENVWDAAMDQLNAKYAVDYQAEGRGAYIVLWFGDSPGKQLPAHPSGIERPRTPEELEQMLNDRLPEAQRSLIDVFVIDVCRPSRASSVNTLPV